MYAELIGNYKNYRIKSLWDNILMAEVGDEELNDILPKKVEVISKEFQDIGYYIDERGYRRFGVIPKVRQVEVKARWDLYDGRNVTSDPRYR